MFVTLGKSHAFMLVYGIETSLVLYLPVILHDSLY